MKSFRVLGIAMAMSLTGIVAAANADVMLTNGQFTTDMSGWTSVGAAMGRSDGTESNHSPDGASLWFTQGWLVGSSTTPLVSLVEGQTYKFSFLAALLWDTTGGGTTQADIDHRSLHADLQVAGGSFVQINPELTFVNSPDAWHEYSATFTATANDVNKTYAPEFLASLGAWTGHSSGVGDCYFGIDRVTLTAVSTPEPSSALLLALSTLGLLAYAWRKRK